MMRDLVLLTRLQLQISWNRFWRMKLGRKLLNIIVIGLFAAAMIVISGFIGLEAGRIFERFPELHLESLLPGLILTAIALLLLISSFGLALGSLFFSRDLELLMSAPVNRRAVFTTKILNGFATYYGMVFILAVPALVAYGVALGYGALYYILMLIAVLGTPLLPAGVGALLVLLVARVAPARRVREVLGLVAALFGTSCALIGNTTSFWTRQLSGANSTLEGLLKTVQGFANLPVPSLMAGRGLAEAGQGSLLPALGLMSAFLVLTFGFFIGCIWVADRMYATGWLRMQGAGEARRKAATAASEKKARRDLLNRATPFFAIALKDWRIIPRDLRNFAQFLSPLFLIPLIYIQLFVDSGGRSGRTLSESFSELTSGLELGNVLLAGTVLLSTIFVFTRIAQTGISMEGRSYWILKSAPISGRELLLGKFVAALVPFTTLATLLLVIAAFVRQFSLLGFLYGWFGVMLLGSAILAMDVGLSVPWANLDWDDPRRMRSSWGGILGLIGSIVIAVLGGLFLSLPYITRVFLPFLAPVAWLVGPFFAVGFSGAAAAMAFSFGLSRLRKVGEN